MDAITCSSFILMVRGHGIAHCLVSSEWMIDIFLTNAITLILNKINYDRHTVKI